MTLSRRFSRHSAAALLAACVAAACADTAFAAGQAAAPGDAGPVAGAGAGSRGAERGHGPRGDRGPDDGPQHGFGAHGFGEQGFGEQGFGGSRPGAPGLDGPTPDDMPPRGPGGFGLFGHLHRLRLSEAQQDKLFAIMHAAAPQRRNQQKAERKAHEALRALGASPQFDEARASAAARELGQAVATGALLRARLASQVLAMLTPEQREQLHRERPPRPPKQGGR